MVLKRRGFLLTAAAGLAALAVPAKRAAVRLWPGAAVKGAAYPGKVRALRRTEMKRPGRWAG